MKNKSLKRHFSCGSNFRFGILSLNLLAIGLLLSGSNADVDIELPLVNNFQKNANYQREDYCIADNDFLEGHQYCENRVEDLLLQLTKGKKIQAMQTKRLPKCVGYDFPFGIYNNVTFQNYVKKMLIKPKYLNSFDHRENQNCPSISEISDQGDCESCWAVAATDVMTDRLCLRSNGTIKTRFSIADLLSCCKACQTPPYNSSCTGGGKHEIAWSYWKEVGIVSGYYSNSGKIGCRNYKVDPCKHLKLKTNDERDVTTDVAESKKKCKVRLMKCPSHEEKEPTCEEECDEGYDDASHSYQQERERMKGEECYYLNRQFDGKELAIKLEIVMHGPVHAFMSTYESLYKLYSDATDASPVVSEGVPYFDKPNADNDNGCGGHSVRIVGWDKSTINNRSYWIVANTWGEGWGSMNGFFYLDFDHDKRAGDFFPKGKERVYAGIPKLD